eukprot:m.232182 g.232182  ORF g.232182 m.232182 type:complete len:347 (-) comp33616_c2_seq5:176-1216(-)
MSDSSKSATKSKLIVQVAAALVYLLSGPSLIMVNRSLLKEDGFKYPMALASIGLWFSWSITMIARQLDYVKPSMSIERSFFLKKVLPIGMAQAFTFKFGMQAYLHNGVAFIQMMKAFTPATTMAGLTLLGKPAITQEVLAVFFICIGTVVAAYGEIHLTLIGLFCIAMAEVSECGRLVMTQLLLTDHKFTIVDALLYVTPAGAIWLTMGSIVFELEDMVVDNALVIVTTQLKKFIAAGLLGFVVNTASFFVIQTSGAVALKVLGTARNAGLIVFCAVFMGEHITALESGGYVVALAAFSYYTRLQLLKSSAPPAVTAEKPEQRRQSSFANDDGDEHDQPSPTPTSP